MTDIKALIERLEAAKGADMALDAAICVLAQYGGQNSDGATNVRTDPDWEGDLLFEVGAEECCNPIPDITASLDAAVAFAERVLPGWVGMVNICYPRHVNGGCQVQLTASDACDDRCAEAVHKYAAISVLIATLRALQAQGGSDASAKPSSA